MVVELQPTNAEECTVSVSHLQFTYPGCEPFLKDVTFPLPKGSRCLLIGANGAGSWHLNKSTSINKLDVIFLAARQGLCTDFQCALLFLHVVQAMVCSVYNYTTAASAASAGVVLSNYAERHNADRDTIENVTST